MNKTVNHRHVLTLSRTGQIVRSVEALPDLAPGTVLVRIRASMISAGTQLGAIRKLRSGETDPLPQPIPLGYQAAGDVVTVGEGVKRLAPGDRIACFGSGAQHADLGVVHQNLCVRLPDEVGYVEASGLNLVLTALHAVRRAEAVIGEFMLVVGLGIVGQLVCQFARASGLYVMGWDTIPRRLQLADAHSADVAIAPDRDDVSAQCDQFTGGLGFDCATLAIGGDGTAALEQVKSVMKVTPDTHAMGKIIMVGGLTTMSSWGAGMGNLDLRSSARTGPGYHDPSWELGQTAYPAVFVRWSTQNNLQLAARMMRDRRIDVASLITHQFPMRDAEEAVELLVNQGSEALGVVLIADDAASSGGPTPRPEGAEADRLGRPHHCNG